MCFPVLVTVQPLASLFSLNGRPRYFHEGWFLISYANLAVIVCMIALFGVALVLPFPHGAAEPTAAEEPAGPSGVESA